MKRVDRLRANREVTSIAEYRNRKINELGHHVNVLDVVKFAKADTKWVIDSVVLEIAERWA